jgi:serine/threonine protein kinase/tetratricopeptide (TPR) repeat protein
MADEFARLQTALNGRYALTQVLGQGGMATVYLAQDLRHGRSVALKHLRPELSFSLTAERFKQEISISARLAHPHIVPLLDSGEVGGQLFYVMPHVEGETVAARLSREGPLNPTTALAIARDVAGALEYAHARGVIHRDIKPENILLTARHAVLTDFGIARAIEVASRRDLTAEGSVMGTVAYMSPEQAAGEVVDGRADLYALACVLYEMLTGETPFGDMSMYALITEKVLRTSPSLDGLKRVPPPLWGLIERTLSREPALRPQSASEFLSGLEQATRTLSNPGTLAWPSRFTWARRGWLRNRKLSVRLAAVGALILLGVASLKTLDALPTDSPLTGPIVVLPFHAPTSTPRDDSLGALLADELIRQLNGWQGLTAVTQVSLTGPMFDAGMQGPAIRLIEDGYRIAGAVGADELLTVAVAVKGDSAWLTVNVFQSTPRALLPRSRWRDWGNPITYGGPASDLFALAAPAVSRILGLEATAEGLARLQRYSRNPTALSQFQEGRRLLDEWNLSEAESHLRRAADLDSTFALAHHFLALTRYWQAVEVGDVTTRGPEIARLETKAVAHAQPLPSVEQDHIRAFHAFMVLGDYETARNAYRRLLVRDSTDVYASLLLGSIEFSDPWLTRVRGGGLAPRRNYNEAMRAFRNAIRLSPGFDLGYGQLFNIYTRARQSMDQDAATLFFEPGERLIAPWENVQPTGEMRAFYLFPLDSLTWVDRTTFAGAGADQAQIVDSLESPRLEQGARRLEGELFPILERWLRYDSSSVRANKEMATWIIREVTRPWTIAPPEWITERVRNARTHLRTALDLSSDTLPRDLLLLANLDLALGEVPTAVTLVGEALASDGVSNADRGLAANVFAATGQVSRLLALDLGLPPVRFAQEGLVPVGDGGPHLLRLRVLASTGVGGPRLETSLRELERAWGPPDYSPEESRSLWTNQMMQAVAPALVLERTALRRYTSNIDSVHPLVRAFQLVDSDSAAARIQLMQALAEPYPTLGQAGTMYLGGLAAQMLADHSLAARAFARLDSLPPDLRGFSPTWGYRTLSYALRARSLGAMGDTAQAEAHRQRFQGYWANADSLAATLPWLADIAERGGGRGASGRDRWQ